MAEVQDLARVNGEIAARVRKIQQVARGLRRVHDQDEPSNPTSFQLIRACRIALLESEESQTVAQIQARIERRTSFVFLGPGCPASMIGQALEEMAVVGEVRCCEGSWARPASSEPAPTRRFTDVAISEKCARRQLTRRSQPMMKPTHYEPRVNCEAKAPSTAIAAGDVR
jgi:hypothetical protein